MGHAGDMEGREVSKCEVLAKLGHPAHWAREDRELEFRKHLTRGATDLDINGIKGVPGVAGYMDYLLNSLRCPLGSDTGLVSAEVSMGIKEMAEREIRKEIQKYEVRLAELEKDPGEVERYIARLRYSLCFLPEMIDPDPNAQPLEELREGGHRRNAEIKENIERTHQEIARYSELLKNLR